MSMTQLYSYTENNQARGRSIVTRRATALPAQAGFALEIEHLFTEIMFVGVMLGAAALLRFGAPKFPGRDEAADMLDFGAACGGLHSLIGIAKTCMLAAFPRQ